MPIGPLDPPDGLATDMENVNSGDDPDLNSDYRTLPIDSTDHLHSQPGGPPHDGLLGAHVMTFNMTTT